MRSWSIVFGVVVAILYGCTSDTPRVAICSLEGDMATNWGQRTLLGTSIPDSFPVSVEFHYANESRDSVLVPVQGLDNQERTTNEWAFIPRTSETVSVIAECSWQGGQRTSVKFDFARPTICVWAPTDKAPQVTQMYCQLADSN
jgi:hypothetical protein